MEQADQIVEVLDQQGPVQPHLVLQGGDLLRGGVFAQDHAGHIAGCQMHDEKHQQRHAQKHRDHVEDTLCDVSRHRGYAPFLER